MDKKYQQNSKLTRELASKRINNVLSSLGKTPTDVSRETNINVQRLFKATRGDSYLSVDGYSEFCEKYRVNANFLLNISDRMFDEMSEEELKEQANYKELYNQAKGEVQALKDTIDLLKQLTTEKERMIQKLNEELNQK
ncbi:hypothetical protein [Chondrinema litorale]|uniref:hypothetical protein n=1 Tax=Chondrinema litorale TaxID=2994555 RepID=UPI002542C996|nr:hypothetical protein [Chondrinema litorale]UZS00285.1 hypothetical protein OQ292_40805 [Chondrinema litorale]